MRTERDIPAALSEALHVYEREREKQSAVRALLQDMWAVAALNLGLRSGQSPDFSPRTKARDRVYRCLKDVDGTHEGKMTRGALAWQDPGFTLVDAFLHARKMGFRLSPEQKRHVAADKLMKVLLSGGGAQLRCSKK